MTEKKVELKTQEIEAEEIEGTEEIIVEEKKPSMVKEKAHAAKAWLSARKKRILTATGVAVAVVGAGVAAAIINAKADEEGMSITDALPEALEDIKPDTVD